MAADIQHRLVGFRHLVPHGQQEVKLIPVVCFCIRQARIPFYSRRFVRWFAR
jgi:hypothetical protein